MVRHDPMRASSSGPVLGIDPGTRHLGWAVVESSGARLISHGHGVLTARANLPVPRRLLTLATALRRIVAEHRPVAAALEEAFYGRDARAAQRIGEARGAIHLVLAEAGVPATGYANNVVKKAVAANGRASKAQVMAMVQRILRLENPVTASDAADALALAICHIQQGRLVANADAGGLSPRIAEALRRAGAPAGGRTAASDRVAVRGLRLGPRSR